MKLHPFYIVFLLLLSACNKNESEVRVVEDFNKNWKFHLGDIQNAFETEILDSDWKTIDVPHDWSIEQGYQKENTASSTGFVVGGIGWYRKHFRLKSEDKGKYIAIQFDGVYNNSSVWINGHLLGKRPNGYSSFQYNLSNYLHYGEKENTIAVKVNRTAYADSRWYTGSGIYRKVQLIKTSYPIHIAQWGVQITTPQTNNESAEIHISTTLENLENAPTDNMSINYIILDADNNEIAKTEQKYTTHPKTTQIIVQKPNLWSIENPTLYKLKVAVYQSGKLIDTRTETFGIRSFKFDANTGFSLNGKPTKIKGVNLHHDAGALGAAVPKAIWEYRIGKLKSIGVNAIRASHNPHSIELMEVCDEMGMLVMNEAFDEWYIPKKKSVVYLGDNAASETASKAYPEHFNKWAEKDLKDLIRRDFNHPSVILWSIGNEIEWTFPHYSKTFSDVNGPNTASGYQRVPIYDSLTIKKAFDKNFKNGTDPLAETAKKLVKWAKEIDTSRPITCGSVLPSIGMASGYGTSVDVYGFNYRAADYDAAHKQYPNLKILGSENWGNYNEWKSCLERDFVAGVFLWTGFAYLGEAGPWPRKGLNISLFDFAGFQTPRGHFFECLWNETPKVYMVTTPEKDSEFSFDKKEGWKFDMQYTAAPVWKMLRLWEWYTVHEKWDYDHNENIVVQTYTNCEEVELFLNDSSLGKQKRAAYIEKDNIVKWLVPYQDGELKMIGYNDNKKVAESILKTPSEFSSINIQSNKKTLSADGYDTAVIDLKLVDTNGTLLVNLDKEVSFELSKNCKLIGIGNGWEKNIQNHKSNKVTTHNGKAVLFIQTTEQKGTLKIVAKTKNKTSNTIVIPVK